MKVREERKWDYHCVRWLMRWTDFIEVMDEINRFLYNEILCDPEFEADDIGELYNESGIDTRSGMI